MTKESYISSLSRLYFRKQHLSSLRKQKQQSTPSQQEEQQIIEPMDGYSHLLKSLSENDPSLTHLELEGSTVPSRCDPFELIRAIRCNTTVRSVEIFKEFLLDLTIEQGRNLFEAFGDLPKCEAIVCDFPNPREGFPLQLHALTCVLTGISPLETFSLRNVVLSRHEHEVSEALQRHAHLREFQVKDLLLVDRKITLDPLLHALARIPTLKVVEIQMKRRQSGALTLGPLRDLCKSKSIRVLKLGKVKLTEELAVLMADALRANTKLKALTLFDCNLTRNGYAALAQMLKVNTSLQELQLYDEKLDDSCCMAIASSLERNSTLQALTMQPLVPIHP